MKEYRKPVAVVLALFLLCGGIIYYINGVYLPGERAKDIAAVEAAQEEQAAQLAARQEQEQTYDYQINPIEPESSAAAESGESEGDVAVTPGSEQETVDREWTDDQPTTPPDDTAGSNETAAPDSTAGSTAGDNGGGDAGFDPWGGMPPIDGFISTTIIDTPSDGDYNKIVPNAHF